ncbi:hypothetical protein [Streptomyces sp. NPDC052036]
MAEPVLDDCKPNRLAALAGWILRHSDTLTESEQLPLKVVPTHCPELD